MPTGRKGIREQELQAAKHYRERIDGAFLKYSTHNQTPHEVFLGHKQVKVDENERENGGSRKSFGKRNAEREFESKRRIPGGPDGQHHMSTGL